MPKTYKILKYINSLPFNLTIKHYFVFDQLNGLLKDGELNSPESWDILREQDPHFSISANRDEWLRASENLVKKDGQDGGLINRAKDIVKIIKRERVSSIFSVGVGGAGLEYQIKKMKPELQLVCSEYAPTSVDLLKKVFVEADSIVLFDMKNKDWSIALKGTDPKKQICLLYRVDINFSDEEMFEIFKNMHDSGIENILIVLCGAITARGIYNRLSQRLSWKIKGIKYSFAGFLRTKKRFRSFWYDLYSDEEVDCAGLAGFLLKKRIK
ncbi:MAG: hypothetical protein AB198_00610 [Parcubacteria bacterium C7867-003]|nr:MAG: hypothetical protein AB198_00610 [Parcubacteria bacterium C7867-003]